MAGMTTVATSQHMANVEKTTGKAQYTLVLSAAQCRTDSEGLRRRSGYQLENYLEKTTCKKHV
jgi:hypothetical protein